MKTDNKNKVSKHPSDPDFFSTICLTCQSACGSACEFLDNRVTFTVEKKQGKNIRLTFDKSLSVCNGQCHKDCISSLNLKYIIQQKHKPYNIKK